MSLAISVFWILLWLLTVSLCLLSLTGFLGKEWWIFDLTSHFRLQYLILLLICAILGVVGGDFLLSLVAELGMIINLVVIIPLYLSPPRPRQATVHYRLVLSNVLGTNPKFDKILTLIEQTNPDVILLLEPTEACIEAILPRMDAYPHRILVPRPDNYGIALFSRYELMNQATPILGRYEKPSIVASLDLDGKPVTLIGTHAQPPFNAQDSSYRDQQIREVVAYANRQPKPTLILGDFNATSWSAAIRAVLRAGFKDSRVGFGIQASWPVANPLLRVPIDHIFTTREVVVYKRRLGPPVGSDHLPVILDFSVG